MLEHLRHGLLGACGLALALTANAGCPDKGGALVMDTKDRSGYYLYQLIGELSFQVFIKGKTFRMDKERIPGHVLYIVDGNAFQLQHVDRKNFVPFVRGEGEEPTLDAQARYEQDYVLAMAPEARIADLGTLERTDAQGRRVRLFRLWKHQMSVEGTAPMYFMATLLDKDTVAMVAASIPGAQADAMDTLRQVALSFGPTPAAECARLPLD